MVGRRVPPVDLAGREGRVQAGWQDQVMSEPEGRGAPQEVAEEAAWAVVGVLGGTGDQGRGLASRLATAGNRVIIGSRDAGRAAAAAATCGPPPQVTAMENQDPPPPPHLLIPPIPRQAPPPPPKQL